VRGHDMGNEVGSIHLIAQHKEKVAQNKECQDGREPGPPGDRQHTKGCARNTCGQKIKKSPGLEKLREWTQMKYLNCAKFKQREEERTIINKTGG